MIGDFGARRLAATARASALAALIVASARPAMADSNDREKARDKLAEGVRLLSGRDSAGEDGT